MPGSLDVFPNSVTDSAAISSCEKGDQWPRLSCKECVLQLFQSILRRSKAFPPHFHQTFHRKIPQPGPNKSLRQVSLGIYKRTAHHFNTWKFCTSRMVILHLLFKQDHCVSFKPNIVYGLWNVNLPVTVAAAALLLGFRWPLRHSLFRCHGSAAASTTFCTPLRQWC